MTMIFKFDKLENALVFPVAKYVLLSEVNVPSTLPVVGIPIAPCGCVASSRSNIPCPCMFSSYPLMFVSAVFNTSLTRLSPFMCGHI
jgi:hypothetical protein